MTDLTKVLNSDKFDLPPSGISLEDLERWKEYRKKYHAAQKIELSKDFPPQLDFGLSSDCNYKCWACVQNFSKTPRRIMPFELFRKAISEGEKYGLCSIKLNHNNEPLLLDNLQDYIYYAKDHGILNTYIATNGSLLTPEYSRRLIEAGLNKIMISVDAVTAETYRAMRNSTLYKRIVKNIESLIKLRDKLGKTEPLVRVNFLRTMVNIHEESAFIDKWKNKVDMIGFQEMLGIPGVNSELFRDIIKNDFRCSFPFKHIVISVDGNLLPCCTFSGEKIVLGNIKNMTIAEAWNCPTINELRELHRRGEYLNNPICAHCIGR